MIDESSPVELCIECAVVLGSLAKGSKDDVRRLIDAGSISVLLKGRLCMLATVTC